MLDQKSMNWADVIAFGPKLMTVVKVGLIIISLDLMLSILSGFVMPETFHFNRYVSIGDEGEKLSDDYYEEIMGYFFDADMVITSDENVGWVNTPNYQEDYDEDDPAWDWYTNSLGALISSDKEQTTEQSKIIAQDNAIFLFGSSVVAGYGLKEEQRLSGFLQSMEHTAINFGSVEYTIDQSYALYKSKLAQFKPTVIVVGLHNEPEAISNMFTPFRKHSSPWEPYLKPAYQIENGELVQLLPPVEAQRNHDIPKMMAVLQEHDAQYSEYRYFKYLSLLPFSDFVRRSMMRLRNKALDKKALIKAFEIQKYFMKKFVETAAQDGTQVIFVKFELSDEIEDAIDKPFVNYIFGDPNTYHTGLLKSLDSMNIIVAADVFNETGRSPYDFYLDNDNLHLSAEGNQLLAEMIAKKVDGLTADASQE